MPIIYRSTDLGAPSLDDSPGALVSLFDACLVNGYGSGENAKLPAGWSKPFSTADRAVYRNSAQGGGTGSFYRLEDSGDRSRLQAFSDMAGVDDGIGNGTPNAADYPDGVTISKGDGSSLEWILIADSRTVWFSAFANMLVGFGDYESFLAADAGRYFVAGHKNTNTFGESALAVCGVKRLQTSNIYTGMFVATAADQTDSAQRFSIPYVSFGRDASAGIDGGVSGDYIGGSGAPMPIIEPHTNGLFFTPAFVGCEGLLRGRLRGALCPLNDLRGEHGQLLNGGDDVGDVICLTAKGYYGIGNGPKDVGALAFAVSSDW